MARRNVIDWDDAKILEASEGATTKAEVARRIGVNPSTLSNHLLNNVKLRDELEQRLQPMSLLDTRDVLDPVRLKEDQQNAERNFLVGQNRDLRKELASREAVVERIIQAAKVPIEVPDFPPLRRRRDEDLPTRSAVLPIFDLQYGQRVRPSDTPLGMGLYNTGEVFDERLERYYHAASSSLRDLSAGHNIKELVIGLGGDLVEGDQIFRGQAWQLDANPVQQLLELRRKLGAMLANLIAQARSLGVENVALFAVPGNHGKVGGKQAGATPTDYSWDHLLGELIADDLRSHVDLLAIEPGGYLLFEAGGHRFLMIHGDEVRGHMGIPFYGLTRFDGRALRLVGENAYFHFALLGHHHQQSNIPNGHDGRYIMSGDWVGANNLSKHLASATRPQQRLLLVGERYGITHDVPLYLTLRDDHPAPKVHSLA